LATAHVLYVPKVVAFASRSFIFLGWSDYDDSSGYENFGWWDLQGDPENADQEEADEIDLDPDSDEADDFAECISPYE